MGARCLEKANQIGPPAQDVVTLPRMRPRDLIAFYRPSLQRGNCSTHQASSLARSRPGPRQGRLRRSRRQRGWCRPTFRPLRRPVKASPRPAESVHNNAASAGIAGLSGSLDPLVTWIRASNTLGRCALRHCAARKSRPRAHASLTPLRYGGSSTHPETSGPQPRAEACHRSG